MINYEQAVTLVYLGFRLMIFYRIIATILSLLCQIPHIIEIVNREKRQKDRDKKEMEKEKIIFNEKQKIEAKKSDYKSTRIGFMTTIPYDMTDERDP